MYAWKAHVRGGRLVLDAPTALPEGTEVELVAADEASLGGEGEFDAEERARLIEAIEEGEACMERGEYVDGIAFANQLLADREAQIRSLR